MSDPMTNTEVEDVLSSIRRLVSDEKTPVQDAQPSGNRLVLTPSLRVMGNAIDMGELSNEDVAADDDTELNREDETATPKFNSEIEVTSDNVQANSENVIVEKELGTGEMGNSAVFSDPISLAEGIDPRPDGSADSAEQITVQVAQPAKDIGEKIANLEKLIARRADQWEPDDVGTDPYAGTQAPAMAWEDTEEADDHDIQQDAPAYIEAAAAVADGAEEQNEPLNTDDNDVLDEEALRELVSDIVRSELQGELGERITRNVRKLVRREIHRALTAQDLE